MIIIDKEKALYNKENVSSSNRKSRKKRTVELLAPAGDIEKARVAVSYGATAIYLAGKHFALRSAASNFDFPEIEKAVSYAHNNGAKVYLALNSFLYNEDVEELVLYLRSLNNIEIDALIISDIGVLSLVKEFTNFDIHLSTQASTTHFEALKFWKSEGIKRIVLAREVSIAEARAMKSKCDIELEMFIHGSLCMSYSGKCVISNYTANRDANRGGCVNSCRWEYDIKRSIEDDFLFTNFYVMNSKDLSSAELIPEILASSINSLKIEGRMKSAFYLASVVRVYRDIIDLYLEGKEIVSSKKKQAKWQESLSRIPNRGFTSAFLKDIRKASSVLYESLKGRSISNFIGIVKSAQDDFVAIEVKNSFSVGDSIFFLLFSGKTFSFHVNAIYDINWDLIPTKAVINSLVFLKNANFSSHIEAFNVVFHD